jgi:hypothetical protein
LGSPQSLPKNQSLQKVSEEEGRKGMKLTKGICQHRAPFDEDRIRAEQRVRGQRNLRRIYNERHWSNLAWED